VLLEVIELLADMIKPLEHSVPPSASNTGRMASCLPQTPQMTHLECMPNNYFGRSVDDTTERARDDHDLSLAIPVDGACVWRRA
jgi:hypothetical protein